MRRRVIDLLHQAGIDVSDWANFQGGPARAAMNPKYCYEWSFRDPEQVVLNLWHNELKEDHGTIFQTHNLRKRAGSVARSPKEAAWKRRAERMDEAIRAAYRDELPLRVILCEGKKREAGDPDAASSSVDYRLLDPLAWAVASYSDSNGACVLVRGALPVAIEETAQDPELQAFDGEQLRRFVLHRKRERKLRDEKI